MIVLYGVNRSHFWLKMIWKHGCAAGGCLGLVRTPCPHNATDFARIARTAAVASMMQATRAIGVNYQVVRTSKATLSNTKFRVALWAKGLERLRYPYCAGPANEDCLDQVFGPF